MALLYERLGASKGIYQVDTDLVKTLLQHPHPTRRYSAIEKGSYLSLTTKAITLINL